MSWKDETTSNKNTIFTINVGRTMAEEQLWVKHYPNVWKTTWAWDERMVDSPTYGFGAYGFGTWGKASLVPTPDSPNDVISIIGSFEIDGEDYLKVNSPEEVQTTLNSFYWSTEGQVLYVHYDGFIANHLLIKKVGELFGFSFVGEYNNSVYYQPLLKSVPSVTSKRDNLFKNVAKFGGGKVTCDNVSGIFDRFNEEDIYGKVCQILVGETGSEDYEPVFTGFIRDFGLSGDNAVFSMKDERQNLERKIGVNYLDKTDYPNLKKDGTLIPITYGTIKNGLSICLNEEDDSATDYIFKFSDTALHNIQSVSQVYVNGDKVTHTAEDLTTGEITLDAADFKRGQKVTVDFNGYVDDLGALITNGLDIVKDLLLVFDDKTYNSNNYNTIEWEEQTLLAPDCNIFLRKDSKLINVIIGILSGFGVTFQILGDGRFTAKRVDFEKESVKVIHSEDMLNINTDEDYRSEDYISSVRVGYSQDYQENEYSWYNNDSQEQELFLRNKSYKEQDFKTNLTNKADAQEYSETLMEIYGGIFAEFKFKTMIQNVDLDLEDNIKVYVKKDDNRERFYKMEVISINKNLSDYQVEIVGRYISEILLPEYFILEWVEDPDYIVEWSVSADHIIDYWA